MAQFARPSADTVNQSWTDQAGGGATIYTKIDEVAVDDADYIRSAVAPTSDVFATALTSIEDPQSSSGHVVRYRYAKDAAGGAQIDLTAQLRQGYVDEGTLGTLIKEWTHADISDVLSTAAQTLAAAEADAITNYASLFLRFVANQV